MGDRGEHRRRARTDFHDFEAHHHSPQRDIGELRAALRPAQQINPESGRLLAQLHLDAVTPARCGQRDAGGAVDERCLPAVETGSGHLPAAGWIPDHDLALRRPVGQAVMQAKPGPVGRDTRAYQ